MTASVLLDVLPDPDPDEPIHGPHLAFWLFLGVLAALALANLRTGRRTTGP